MPSRPPGRFARPHAPLPASVLAPAPGAVDWIDAKEAARLLGGVHPRTVRRLWERGEIVGAKVGGRRMFSKRSVLALPIESAARGE